jgi:hypothetical protein
MNKQKAEPRETAPDPQNIGGTQNIVKFNIYSKNTTKPLNSDANQKLNHRTDQTRMHQ